MVQIEEDVREKVKSLLRELFQFDNQDLDFGIYRIMNFKRKEIEKFIEQDLIAEAERQFQEYNQAGQADLKNEVDKLRAEIVRDFGEGTLDSEGNVKKNEDAPKVELYLGKKKQLEEAKVTQSQISDVFNHIYEFFSRYYDKGDFIPKRRYGGKNKYYIPYNGEEVALYWATKDMYYVKTGEFFKKYSFRTGRYLVTFVLTEAKVEVGNVKGERKYFMLSPDNPVTIDDAAGLVEIRFNYRGLSEEESSKLGKSNVQATLVNEAIAKIAPLLTGTAVTGILKPRAEGEKPLLEKHLNSYVERNTRDFFIHKNLKGFLESELDFYLKNEVWSLSDLEAADGNGAKILAAKAKAIHSIAAKIIDFLNQIEDFQKKLFEKKKLVLQTDYFLTLDLVPSSFYPEIAKNEQQISEWKSLLNIDKTTQNTFYPTKGKKTLDERFLREHKFLVLDTSHFDQEFKDRLLGTFDNLDKRLDGMIIRSENYQALQLLLNRFRERIKCVHIDPPYNTATSGFLYKNNYQHSSWLSMMADRIKLGTDLLEPDGSFLCHIDENEYEKLHLLFERLSIPDAGTIVWDKRNPMNAGRGVATQHEYIAFRSHWNKPIYLENDNVNSMLNAAAAIIKKNGGVNEKARREYAKWVSDNDRLSGGEKAYRYLDENGEIYQSVSLRAPEPRSDPKFFKPLIHPITKKPCPVPPNGFSRTPETLNQMIRNNQILFGPDETTQPRQKVLLTKESKRQISSVIQDAHKGKTDLSMLGLDFPYCHPVSLYQELLGAVANGPEDVVIDFFAGSGTTAQVIIQLNNNDKQRRKFILVELDPDCFDQILKPRIKKLMYATDWKDNIPKSNQGTTLLVKCLHLEQYEDSLNNIVFKQTDKSIQQTLDNLVGYFVHYMLDYETRESPTRLIVDKFVKPFDYKIRVINSAEEKTVTVDLVETFNYLLGLMVEKLQRFVNGERIYKVVMGKLENKSVCVIWRDLEKIELEKDKQFIESKILAGKSFDFIYVNGDSYVKNARPIEPEFKRLMGA